MLRHSPSHNGIEFSVWSFSDHVAGRNLIGPQSKRVHQDLYRELSDPRLKTALDYPFPAECHALRNLGDPRRFQRGDKKDWNPLAIDSRVKRNFGAGPMEPPNPFYLAVAFLVNY